jgi:hypothetical protein
MIFQNINDYSVVVLSNQQARTKHPFDQRVAQLFARSYRVISVHITNNAMAMAMLGSLEFFEKLKCWCHLSWKA